MKSLQSSIKNKKVVFSLVVLVIILIYLNRSYAYIYEHIDEVGFQSSVLQQEYLIGTESAEGVTYVAVGDSLTAGVGVEDYKQSYPHILAQRISDSKNTVSLKPLAIPGARTKDISGEFLDKIIELEPNIITILSGVNDVYGNVSVKDFEKDYRQLVNTLASKTNSDVYLINLPYIGDSSLILPPYNYYFDYRTKQFNKVIQKIAEENNLVYIDLYSKAKIFAQDNSYYSLDVFHPSGEGYLKWADHIYENINK